MPQRLAHFASQKIFNLTATAYHGLRQGNRTGGISGLSRKLLSVKAKN
jgi:hypothetical protein